ncbi:MAG: TIGR03086 family protein [Frankiaceae bacterium]|nr:TIGR03086 family protein [Frankiaceae bacterium]
MTDIAQLHRRALAETGATVAGIRPDQLADPTPAGEWDVRALLNHVVSGNLWAAELAAGRTIAEVGDRLDGDVLADDAAAAYDASATSAAEAFEAPGALGAPCAVSYGPVPGSVYAGHRFLDVLVHGWDLATATGQDSTLAPELVLGCLDVLEPQLGMLQASGAFGSAVETPTDADPQTRLLGMLGRRAGA